MRAAILLVVTLLLTTAATTHGNGYSDCAVEPSCHVCGRDRESCGCDSRICKPPCPPAAPPQQNPIPQQAPGVFVAPPQAGTVNGPVNSVGIQGMEIEFPALRLRMPTIRFPSGFRSRTNARMMIDAAEAPYVQHGAMPTMAMPVAGVQQAPLQNPQQSPQQQPLTPDQIQRLLEQLDRQQTPLRSPVPCDVPTPCDAATLERARALEATERQLQERIAALEQKLRRLEEHATGPALARQHQPDAYEVTTAVPAANLQPLPARRLPPPLEWSDSDSQVRTTVYQRQVAEPLPPVRWQQEPRRLPSAN